MNDWLGTKRVQAKADGELDTSFLSLPYGDQLTNGTGATEHFFTGKERDSESSNDYFGARYYASESGRFITPDWSSIPEPVPYADLQNPQSLNLYDYVLDNPMSAVDVAGHSGCAGAAMAICAAITNAIANGMDSGAALWGAHESLQPLTSTSTQHIANSPLTASQASAFKHAVVAFAHSALINPNLLVGLAYRESSLNPNAHVSTARGLFQITPAEQNFLHLTTAQVWSVTGAVPTVAHYFGHYIGVFSATEGYQFGQSLAIASWTLGLGEAQHLFSSDGMQAVRKAWLDRNHHGEGRVGSNYIDIIEGFEN